MLRNLDRSGGVVLSEAVLMALAKKIGRDRAHALVLQIARDSQRKRITFRRAVTGNEEVRRQLRPRELEAVLQYRNYLGLAGHFVDQVLKLHEAERRRR
jgi:3-carboxy-cis,cis-muconate cycloisomerase